jgi:hypothetical protein
VKLKNTCIRAEVQEGINLFCEIANVLVGPINLRKAVRLSSIAKTLDLREAAGERLGASRRALPRSALSQLPSVRSRPTLACEFHIQRTLEIADQQQSEVDARRQTRATHRLGVKAAGQRFDKFVKPVVLQQLIEASIEG